MENKRATGTKYEELAVQFLQERGYQILERNFRCREGEIDIIARDGNYLVYVEVKYRSSIKNGYPGESIGGKKQKKIYRVAQYHLYKNGIYPETQPCRFDAVLIEGERIELVQNAFGGL